MYPGAAVIDEAATVVTAIAPYTAAAVTGFLSGRVSTHLRIGKHGTTIRQRDHSFWTFAEKWLDHRKETRTERRGLRRERWLTKRAQARWRPFRRSDVDLKHAATAVRNMNKARDDRP